MTLLDRFTNPLWYRASKLDPYRQRIVASVICASGWYRQQVQESLVGPLESFLKGSSLRPTPLSTEDKIRLTDEALVALFRCCKCPSLDPGGRLPAAILRGLPELLGCLALADINHRLNRSSPNVLDGTHYSKDPAEVRTQVLVKWMEILAITSPLFVTIVTTRGFADAWGGQVDHSMSGMLKGQARVEDEKLIASGRRHAAQIPPGQATIIECLISRLAKTSFS